MNQPAIVAKLRASNYNLEVLSTEERAALRAGQLPALPRPAGFTAMPPLAPLAPIARP